MLIVVESFGLLVSTSTLSFVALLLAINVCSSLALDCTYGDPVALLWDFVLLILLSLSLCRHLDSPY